MTAYFFIPETAFSDFHQGLGFSDSPVNLEISDSRLGGTAWTTGAPRFTDGVTPGSLALRWDSTIVTI